MGRSHDYLEVQPRARVSGSGRAVLRVGGAYDRFVSMMRMVLPAIALAITLLLFAWPALNPSEFSFLLAIDKVRLSPERLRMVKPRYYGTDSRGRPFVIEADSALQETGERERVSLNTIKAQLDLDGGIAVTSKADEGVYFPNTKLLGLEGMVMIKASNGYVIDASDALINLETRQVMSEREVTGVGPMGNFSAQGFDAKLDEHKLSFTGGVLGTLFPNKKSNEAALNPIPAQNLAPTVNKDKKQ